MHNKKMPLQMEGTAAQKRGTVPQRWLRGGPFSGYRLSLTGRRIWQMVCVFVVE